MTTPKVLTYQQYRRKQIAELADWFPGFDMAGVSISAPDKAAGSPRPGDKIARNPANHADLWLVAANYFAANFESIEAEKEGAMLDLNMVLLEIGHMVGANEGEHVLDAVSRYIREKGKP